MKDGLLTIHIIFLTERLAEMPKGEALWTIAHSRLDHGTDGYEAEVEADSLV